MLRSSWLGVLIVPVALPKSSVCPANRKWADAVWRAGLSARLSSLEELAKALDSKIVPNDDVTTPVTRHFASNGAFVPDLAL